MTTLSRKFFVSATTALAAVALVACSPPHEKDSGLKVATATGVSLPSKNASATSTVDVDEDAPGYIDCVAAPTQQPSEISLNCAMDIDQLTEISWSSWDAESATGTGTRVVTTADGQETETEDVEVELSFPTESSQGLVFTQVTVDGQVLFL
ncbi:hypothetical protein N24_1106 [Corynebacterium suranareeae]|uniref:Secreted protein n=1 Tax=Corynebacterium suranareeae TaxID=2506452 RepID=A0A161JNJ5_9CORY|nr:hypothetical protein [Corynebacterium suranareeae]BAU95368.1 hypothetical protein N24_1106 [Corynebacterium suranareeae]